MNALETRQDIQRILGIPADGIFGDASLAAFAALGSTPAEGPWPLVTSPRPLVLSGDGSWSFTADIVGDDIVVHDIVITCFGGAFDPQDNGQTASGVNTKTNAIRGVSIAMDGRQFTGISSAVHRALDGAPIPRLRNAHGLTAWHLPVEVNIGNVFYTPPDGIVDLGPGKQASDPGKPHGLDLTPLAASYFAPNASLQSLSRNFEMRGSFRIIGGAKLIGGASA
jgi:hypothetical protein